ncbi:hypothetical protein AB0N05_37865 [Nocardia sp. NPDC051030]|uniref:hypothetical protein n=1 Tax=Nocardia sp. NPDC051030 TaxID=3155162 RepID=UPI003429EA67
MSVPPAILACIRSSAAHKGDTMIRRRPDGVFEATVNDHRYIRGWSSTTAEMREILRRFGIDDALHADPAQFSDAVAEPEFQAVIDGALDHDGQDLRQRMREAAGHPARALLQQALRDLGPQIPDSDDEIWRWLQQRADELEAVAPQVQHLAAFSSGRLVPHEHPAEYDAFGECAEWVDPRLIVNTPDPHWGEFDRRPENLVIITRAIRDAHTPEAIDTWIDKFTNMNNYVGHIQLTQVEGPAGPLFRLRTNGSHRVHLARILALPCLLARVKTNRLPCPLFVLGLSIPDLDIPDHPLVHLNGLWEGLRQRGLLEVDENWSPTRMCAEWMLMPATHATAVNRAYAHAYPGILEQATGLTAAELHDAEQWTRALIPPAPRRWWHVFRRPRGVRTTDVRPPGATTSANTLL